MSQFLVGYILTELLEGRRDAAVLGRLALRIPNRDTRTIVRIVAQESNGKRERVLDQALDATTPDHAQEILAAIDWARKAGREMCQDAIEKQFPTPEAITLEDAAQEFEDVSWAWDGWIPHGYVTIVAGQSGVGKSQVCLALAAAALGRQPWPTGEMRREDHDRSDVVVWLDTEGSQAMLNQRARDRGLPRDQFLWPADPEQRGNLTPLWKLDSERQFGLFESFVESYRPRMSFIDSLSGAHDGEENSAEIRIILQRLGNMARDTNQAIVLTHHIRKSREGEHANVLEGMERMRGSSAIAQFARSIIGIDAPNPEQPQWLRMRLLKNNLAPLGEPVAAVLENNAVHFGGAVPEPPRKFSVTTEAIDFLLDLLRAGPVPAVDVKKRSEEAAISWTAVERAAKDLNVEKRRQPVQGMPGPGKSMWGLPARQTAIPPDHHEEQE